MASKTPSTFYTILLEFITNLSKTFPDNEGARSAAGMLQVLGVAPATHPQMVMTWYELSNPVLEDIKNKNGPVVAHALNNTSNPMIANIKADTILTNDAVSDETKENVWKYIQSLTALSQILMPSIEAASDTPVAQVPEVPSGGYTSAPPTMPAPQVQPVQQQAPPMDIAAMAQSAMAGKGGKKNNAGDVVKNISEAVPAILESLGNVMKDDQNPLGQILKQVMQPESLQSGVLNNVGANMMNKDPGPVMAQAAAQSGMSVDDIMYKLQKLEMFEKARARRRGGKH